MRLSILVVYLVSMVQNSKKMTGNRKTSKQISLSWEGTLQEHGIVLKKGAVGRQGSPSSRKESKDADSEGQEPENCNHVTLPREQMTMVEDPDDSETRVRKLDLCQLIYVFRKVEEVGEDIGRGRKDPQTWRDSTTRNTLYLD